MIFRYPGGKSKKSVREKIFSYFPKTYKSFREGCVGGGGIFFHVPIEKDRWINDMDRDLISVYTALRDRPEEFINLCRQIKKAEPDEPLAPSRPGGKPLYNARLKAQFDEFLNNPYSDQALKYLFVNRTVWAGRVNYDIPSRLYFSNPSGWNIVFSGKLEKAAEVMRNVKITCGDYEKVLLEEGDDVLIYLDPPYFVNTELDTNSRLYKHNFEYEDHERMRDTVAKCSHKVIISYDYHPEIVKLYDGFNIVNLEWTYCGTSSVVSDGQDPKKKVGKELLITNY